MPPRKWVVLLGGVAGWLSGEGKVGMHDFLFGFLYLCGLDYREPSLNGGVGG
jgi:hypothetical protein